MDLGEVLVSEREIARAVEEITGKVSRDRDLSEVVLVGAMDGAVCFLADLMRAFRQSVDVTTARIRRYDGTEGGEVTVGWLPPRGRIEGKHVLIVDGIVDTGETCAVLTERLSELGAASVGICALLDKPSRRTRDIEPEYVGFEVPDEFVVGYGMDCDGAYRNLRDVRVLGSGRQATGSGLRDEE